jgi:metal-responsive CopG/Arc/MetJ family transcriptional regulator
VFEAGAPDAKGAPKLRGKRQMLTFSLPPDLVAKVDAKAARERRSRANMIEVILQESLAREDTSQEAA